MYCPKCGARFEVNQKYCGNCGTDLTAVVTEQGISSGLVTGEHAGFWRRFAAAIIDAIIIGMVFLILIFTPTFYFGWLLGLVVGWLYYGIMESSTTQATLGKMAMSIVVTDMSGNRVSFGRATGRYFAKIISAIILYIGYLMIAFTEKKQGLHDIIADTLVEVKAS